VEEASQGGASKNEKRDEKKNRLVKEMSGCESKQGMSRLGPRVWEPSKRVGSCMSGSLANNQGKRKNNKQEREYEMGQSKKNNRPNQKDWADRAKIREGEKFRGCCHLNGKRRTTGKGGESRGKRKAENEASKKVRYPISRKKHIHGGHCMPDK